MVIALTYRFSSTIARKGQFIVPQIAAAVPIQIVNLLLDMHTTGSIPVLTSKEVDRRKQKLQAKQEARAPTSSVADREFVDSNVSKTNASTVTPLVLRKRHMPTGTMCVENKLCLSKSLICVF